MHVGIVRRNIPCLESERSLRMFTDVSFACVISANTVFIWHNYGGHERLWRVGQSATIDRQWHRGNFAKLKQAMKSKYTGILRRTELFCGRIIPALMFMMLMTLHWNLTGMLLHIESLFSGSLSFFHTFGFPNFWNTEAKKLVAFDLLRGKKYTRA